jgi:hypothetical protein
MVALVERMLDLHKRLAAEQVPHGNTALQHQIEATETTSRPSPSRKRAVVAYTSWSSNSFMPVQPSGEYLQPLPGQLHTGHTRGCPQRSALDSSPE